MKNIIIRLLVAMLILFNINAVTYAAAGCSEFTDHEYQLTKDNYLIAGNYSSPEKNSEPWLWSFAFPGLGQLLMGKMFKGILFMSFATFFLTIGTYISWDMLTNMNRPGNISLPLLLVPFVIGFLVIYIWSITDAYHLSQKQKN